MMSIHQSGNYPASGSVLTFFAKTDPKKMQD